MKDDLNTKQWCAVFTIEQFYYQVHSQAIIFNHELDIYLPNDLKPQVYLFKSSFKNDIINNDDLKSQIEDYLYKIFNKIGKQLFIEILFNDDVSEDRYFESFFVFNFNGIQAQVEKVKKNLEKCANDCRQTREITILKKNYNYQETLLKKYFERIDELYNIKIISLICKRENLNSNILDSKTKLEDKNSQYGEKVIEKAKACFEKATFDYFQLSNQIDELYLECKSKFVEIYEFLIKNIKDDILLVGDTQFTSFANMRLNEYDLFICCFYILYVCPSVCLWHSSQTMHRKRLKF